MTSRPLIAAALAAGLTLVACGEEPRLTGPPSPQEYQLLFSWIITMPPEYAVSVSHSMYDGRTFSAFREEGNISVRSANTDTPLPDFETLDNPLTFDGHSWFRIDAVESVAGKINALYLIEQHIGPPVRTVALLVSEKVKDLEWGKFTIVALIGYDDGYLDDVLDLIRSVRQASAE